MVPEAIILFQSDTIFQLLPSMLRVGMSEILTMPIHPSTRWMFRELRQLIHTLKENYVPIWLGVILGVIASKIADQVFAFCQMPSSWLFLISNPYCSLFAWIILFSLIGLAVAIMSFVVITVWLSAIWVNHKLRD